MQGVHVTGFPGSSPLLCRSLFSTVRLLSLAVLVQPKEQRKESEVFLSLLLLQYGKSKWTSVACRRDAGAERSARLAFRKKRRKKRLLLMGRISSFGPDKKKS